MMKMNLFPLVVCLLGGFAAGCASNVQFVRIPDLNTKLEDPSKARIYVYRPARAGGAASMEIWDGKVHVGNTGPKSFLCWERKPGEALISGKEENVSTVSVFTKPNQTYYIFQHLRMGWWAARNEMEVVTEEQAKPLLQKCKAPKPGKCDSHEECKGQVPEL